MTREEAIEHARYVRELSKDCSVIALDADVIDALLSNPWHKASEELPEEEKEVIVIYDDGYLCYNHRPKKGGCFLRPDGEKIPYRPIVDDAGWCDFPKQATHGHKVVLWTENPMEN